MRILHVGKFYPPVRGGMETVLASLCEGTAHRWRVRAVVAHDGARTVRERIGGVEVIRVGTGHGVLSILELQPEGKRVMTAREFLAGHVVQPGLRFA